MRPFPTAGCAAPAPTPTRSVLVTDIVTETATATTFGVEPTDSRTLPAFLAGQHVTVFLDGHARPFSISSSPTRLDHYDLTVRRGLGDGLSNLLIDRTRLGDELVISEPRGTLHHRPGDGADLVFLAAGVGVAPAMSMICDMVDRGLNRTLHLIGSFRDATEIVFGAEFHALAASRPGIRVDQVLTDPEPGWTGATGLLTARTLTALTGGLGHRMVYLCGSQTFCGYARAQLAALAHPRARIRAEITGPPRRPMTDWLTDARH